MGQVRKEENPGMLATPSAHRVLSCVGIREAPVLVCPCAPVRMHARSLTGLCPGSVSLWFSIPVFC